MITESKLRKEVKTGCAIYKLDGVTNPVKADCILDGKVEFTGKNFEGKTKSSRLAIADFCKIAIFYDLNKVEQEAAEMEESNDTQDGTEQVEIGSGLMEASGLGESDGSENIVDLSASSDLPSNITEDMLQVGYRFVLSDAVGEVEILKRTKKKLGYLSLTELSIDAKDRPDMVMVDKAEFLTQVNAYLDAKAGVIVETVETKTAPKIKKKADPELTIKKTSDELQVDLTPAEVLAYHEKLSGLLAEIRQKEATKKSFVKQFTGEIDKMEAEVGLLMNAVNSKKECRHVPVSIEYHWKKNKRITIRLDTNAIISETAIPKHELQETFFES